MDLSPDGVLLAPGDRIEPSENVTRVFDTRSGGLVATLPQPPANGARRLVFGRGGALLAAGDYWATSMVPPVRSPICR